MLKRYVREIPNSWLIQRESLPKVNSKKKYAQNATDF